MNRKIFYVDVGSMPSEKAAKFLADIKAEMEARLEADVVNPPAPNNIQA